MSCPNCHSPVEDQALFCSRCGYALDASQPSVAVPSVGSVLDGRYRLRFVIGSGGMGSIYRAEVIGLGHPVAVKILHPALAADPVARKRLENEARLASQLDHPNIVSILDFRSTGGITYLVMEYLSGQSLADVLSALGYLGVRRAIHITRQLLSALEAAHSLPVLHRDLKPENIHLVARHDDLDYVKMLDFGMAMGNDPNQARITTEGYICGTPAYMAPEQAQGKDLDVRTDLYAVGIVLYECLTAVNPFLGGSPADTLLKQISANPPPPSKVRKEAKIPPYLDALCLRALRKAPGDRFQTAAEFREVLEGLVLARHRPDQVSVPARTCSQCGRATLATSDRCDACGMSLGERASASSESIKAFLPDELVLALDAGGSEYDPQEVDLQPTSTITACPTIGWDPPMVGMEREREIVRGLLARSRSSFLRLIGPPGAGKGRLAREAMRDVAHRDWTKLWVDPDLQSVFTSLSPIQHAARQLLRLSSKKLDSDEALLSAALDAGVDPRHRVGLGELFGLETVEAPADERRARRAEAWRAVVHVAADSGALLLVFHDIGRMDAPSQELVAALAVQTSVPRHPLHIIVTHDPGLLLLWPETDVRSLGPLRAMEAETLAAQLIDYATIEGDAAQIAAASKGLPLMLIECARLAAVERPEHYPRSLAEVITKRLNRLPPRARVLVHALSVLGRAADIKTLARLIGAPEADAGALTLLARQGFVSPGPHGWRMAHRVHLDVAYASTPAAVREALHRKAAELAIEAGDPPGHAAHHLFEAGARRQAVPYLLDAGWAALRALDDQLASRHFNRVLETVPQPPGSFDGRRAAWSSASLGLATALSDAGDHNAALALLKGAISSARAAGWATDAQELERKALEIRTSHGLSQLGGAGLPPS